MWRKSRIELRTVRDNQAGFRQIIRVPWPQRGSSHPCATGDPVRRTARDSGSLNQVPQDIRSDSHDARRLSVSFNHYGLARSHNLLLGDLFVDVLDHERPKTHSDLRAVSVKVFDKEIRRLASGDN